MNRKVLLSTLFISSALLFSSTCLSYGSVPCTISENVTSGRDYMTLNKLTIMTSGRSLGIVKEVLVSHDKVSNNLLIEFLIPAENVSVKLVNITTGQTVYSNTCPVNQADQEIIDLNGLAQGQYELTIAYTNFVIVGSLSL